MARFSFLVFIFAAMVSVCAQQPKDTTYIKPGQYLLEEMVGSASRWEQNTARIPATITTLKQSEVQLQTPQTAADLLGLVNGVFIQKSQQGGGSPVLRGFGALSRVFPIQNLDEAEVYGAQVALLWNLGSHLKASGALNVQAGREEDENSGKKFTPSHVPPHSANFSLRYTRNQFTTVLFESNRNQW